MSLEQRVAKLEKDLENGAHLPVMIWQKEGGMKRYPSTWRNMAGSLKRK